MDSAPPCPRCNRALAAASVAGALWQCPHCNGCWLPAEEFQPLVLGLGLDMQDIRGMAEQFGGDGLTCPACTRRMQGARLKGAALDVCHGCGGCWVDGGELDPLTGGKHSNPARLRALPVPAARRSSQHTMALEQYTSRRPGRPFNEGPWFTAALVAVGVVVWGPWVLGVGGVVAALWMASSTQVVVLLPQRVVQVAYRFAGATVWHEELKVDSQCDLHVMHVRPNRKSPTFEWHLVLRGTDRDLTVGIFGTELDAHQRGEVLASHLELEPPVTVPWP